MAASHALCTQKKSQPSPPPSLQTLNQHHGARGRARQTYLEEAGHGLIRTADLDLEEGRLPAVAPVGRTLDLGLLRIVPRAGPAKDILSLLALEDAARVEGLVDCVLVGAGAAF